jgi:hypothetical protein
MERKKIIEKWARRRANIAAQRAKRWTLERIAKHNGISKQRVLQILKFEKQAKENGNETGEGPIRVT